MLIPFPISVYSLLTPIGISWASTDKDISGPTMELNVSDQGSSVILQR